MSRLYLDGKAQLLFTENETNAPLLWNTGGPGFFKDGFHERIVDGRTEAVNPANTGTKAGVWFESTDSRRRQRGVTACASRAAPSSTRSRISRTAWRSGVPRRISTTRICKRT